MPFRAEIGQAPKTGNLARPRRRSTGTRGCDVRMRPAGVRVGVVGVGYWGSRHLRVLQSTTGVVSVVGVDQRFAQIDNETQQADHVVPVYASPEDALPDVDAVIIATPPASHVPL